jgi:hypothetical protein
MTRGKPPLAFNGTAANEREVQGFCLRHLHVGAGQVVHSLTTSGSRVGLDRGMKHALIYAGQQSDWNVGSGGYRLFSKREGSWTGGAKVGAWLS